MKSLFLIIFLLFCSGCAMMNPYTQFYQDSTGGVDISKAPNVILPTGEPKIFSGTNVNTDTQTMLENGYIPLGFSSFNSGDTNKGQLIAQARKVNAETVIFYSKYTHTVSGDIPLTLPDTKTIVTNNSGTAFNSGNIYGYGGSASYHGSGSYLGSSTTTVYGTKTTYIPYSQNHYDYLATYWIKTKKPIFGVFINDLTSEMRQKIGSNKGVIVIAVVKESPAFMSDVLKGDILRKINNFEIIDTNSFMELMPRLQGQNVSVEILRDNKNITKNIKLNTLE